MSVIEEEVRSLLGREAWKNEFKLVNPNRQNRKRPEDVHHSLDMTLEKLYNGASIRIRAEKKIPCLVCAGQTSMVPCGGCRGTGHIVASTPCSLCLGKGRVHKPWCGNEKCHHQSLKEEKFFTVNIPTGALNGQQIVLKGEGDALLGDPRTTSDIVCTVYEKPHDRFRRCGNNLYHIKSIDINQALCGCAFPLKHLDNRMILVKSKTGVVIRPGDMKVIKREGMPILNSKTKGDLIVMFNVVFPAKIDIKNIENIKTFFPKKNCDIPENAEDGDLVMFDPTEQVYHVPFRQADSIDDSSSNNHATAKMTKIPTCAQQ